MGKKLWYHSKYLALLLLFAGNGYAQVKPASFRFVDHIQGYWRMTTKRSVFTEYWEKVDEHTWRGITYHITGKDSVMMDRMQLQEDGKDMYYSVVGLSDKDGKPALFKVTVIQANGFVAENPDVDYPQKVVYKWKKADDMEVHFKGIKEKTFSEIILEYKRK